MLLAVLAVPAWGEFIALGVPVTTANVALAASVAAAIWLGALQLRARARAAGRPPMAGQGWYLGILALALVGTAPVWLIALSVVAWAIAPNPAHTLVQPLLDYIHDSGGKELCNNGDPGRGPDNSEPWYSAYFDLPDEDLTKSALRAEAVRLRLPGAGRPASPSTETTGASLTIADSRFDQIRLNCGTRDYGRSPDPAPGHIVVAVDLDLPSSH